MKVADLITALERYPRDAEVAVSVPMPDEVTDGRPVVRLSYWTAYNMAFVIID